jgi:dipeptidyl aminopeptidase/acylaminoacyl peptidase
MGQSAGGYLTLTAGFRLTPRPRCLVSFWGYGDIAGPWYSRPSEHYRKQPPVSREDALAQGGSAYYLYLRQQGLWPKALTGHDPDLEPRAFDPFCPVRNIASGYPPTMLVHGTQDTDVPYEQSELMDKELTRKRVEHQFVTIPGAGHGLAGSSAKTFGQVYERVISFLDNHLKKKG